MVLLLLLLLLLSDCRDWDGVGADADSDGGAPVGQVVGATGVHGVPLLLRGALVLLLLLPPPARAELCLAAEQAAFARGWMGV